MNDFTKEELEKIQICIEDKRHKKPIFYLCLQSLSDKIQSLIDNYCEHE